MSTSSPIDWPQLIAHLEALWQRPEAEFIDELLAHIRHEIVAFIEPVTLGTRLLLGYFELAPEMKTWAQQCLQSSEEWLAQCRSASNDCLAQQIEESARCQCYLVTIGPLFNNSALWLATLPGPDSVLDTDGVEMLATIKKGLTRLALISVELEHNDLTWLKEVFDLQAERRRRAAS